MAKRKLFSKREFEDMVKRGGDLHFTTTPQFKAVTVPPLKVYFYASHWVEPCSATAVTTGTLYICRNGEPFDIDVYSLRNSPENRLIVGLNKQEVADLGYHHVEDLPEVLNDRAPEWVRAKIQKARYEYEHRI